MALNSNWVLSLASFLRKSSLFFLQKNINLIFIPWPKHHSPSAYRKLSLIYVIYLLFKAMFMYVKSLENKHTLYMYWGESSRIGVYNIHWFEEKKKLSVSNQRATEISLTYSMQQCMVQCIDAIQTRNMHGTLSTFLTFGSSGVPLERMDAFNKPFIKSGRFLFN